MTLANPQFRSRTPMQDRRVNRRLVMLTAALVLSWGMIALVLVSGLFRL